MTAISLVCCHRYKTFVCKTSHRSSGVALVVTLSWHFMKEHADYLCFFLSLMPVVISQQSIIYMGTQEISPRSGVDVI